MTKKTLFFALITLLFLAGCKKDDGLNYEIPSSYNFENVSYAGQTTRLSMMDELSAYMKTSNASGTSVSASVMKNMLANSNAPFASAELNNSSKQIRNKCFSLDVTSLEAWMDSLEVASQSTVAGGNGIAGVVTGAGGAAYLFDANGVEYTQFIEKGLMGMLIYYQITSVYLSEDKIGDAVDNTTVEPGEGTPMEHHWDEAFGYFGVPKDFPANQNDLKYLGKYCNGRDGLLGLNEIIMNAYLKGRAAISNEDMEEKWVQAGIIQENLEKVFAATAIHYLNGALDDLADDALRNHQLSEAVAFIRGLKYSPIRSISEAEIQSLVDGLGTNFYSISANQITTVRDQLSTHFGFDDYKTQL